MAPPITLRSSEGLQLIQNPPNDLKATLLFEGDNRDNQIRRMSYNKDGSMLAWSNPQSLFVTETEKWTILVKIDHAKVVDIKLSPKGSFLATWSHYTVDQATKTGQPNLHIYCTKTGTLLKSVIQKKQQGWEPQWSNDEGICVRNSNNVLHFYEGNKFDNIKTKLDLFKISDYSLAQCSPGNYMIAAYCAGTKGQPSFVRVYKYPNFGGPSSTLANKSFFKAERIHLYWNKIGTALVVLTSTESSDSSYYGDQGLHYISLRGETCLVPLDKNGPVYNVEWNPTSTEFAVVYGYMPAKVALFNLKCDMVFDFGTGPRNLTYYNPQGNILCIAGFGNLSGNLEFWDVKQKKLIFQTQASDSTLFEWSPDGQHVLTATTAPRLRVGNGFKIWHYTGSLLANIATPQYQELWDVKWCPAPDGKYKEERISYTPVESKLEAPKPQAKAAPYRPPSARGTATSFKLHEYELPSNQKPKPGAVANAPLTKNQKKKANKKAKNQAEREEREASGKTDPPRPEGAIVVEKANTGDPAKDKSIDKIRKKLHQIEKLKEAQKSGKQLQEQEKVKLATESELIKELAGLGISVKRS
ncbi:hypothetical protein LOTGIDRAFT_234486, partial [Lottia gigantea]